MSAFTPFVDSCTIPVLSASLLILAALAVRLSIHRLGSVQWSRPAIRNTSVLGGVCLATIAWNVHVHPAKHRLFYDEDAYANMASNIIDGFGGTLTREVTPHGKQTSWVKWPLGFPVCAAPFVACWGPETGPAILNGLIGVATLLVLMLIVGRLTRSWIAPGLAVCLYGLHPIVGAWYRAGSTEPLAVLLIALLAWAAVESRDLDSPGSVRTIAHSIALLSALIAIHIRLDNVALAIPFCLLLPRAWPPLSWGRSAWLLLILLPLAALFALHAMRLRETYLTGLPESTFSADFFTANAWANIRYDVQYLPWPSFAVAALLFFELLITRLRQSPATLVPGVMAWGALALIQFLLLSLYSVGQYTAPGGSRFFLVPCLCLAVVTPLLLMHLIADRWRPVCATVLICAIMPARDASWSRFDAQYRSAELEHTIILTWAKSLPREAVVLSRVPYLWEACGVYAVDPGHFDVASHDAESPLYEHRGLLDGLSVTEPPRILGSIEDTLLTEHGTIMLIRLPTPD